MKHSRDTLIWIFNLTMVSILVSAYTGAVDVDVYQNFGTSNSSEPYVQLTIQGKDAYDANHYTFVSDTKSDSDGVNNTVIKIEGQSDGSGWAVWGIPGENSVDNGIYKVALALRTDKSGTSKVKVGQVDEESGSYYLMDTSICTINDESARANSNDYFDTDLGGCSLHLYNTWRTTTSFVIITFYEQGYNYYIDEIFLSPA